MKRALAHQDWNEQEPAEPEREDVPPRKAHRHRLIKWLVALGVLVLLFVLLAPHLDEYLRRTLEAKVNQRLQGYTVTLGHAHLSLLDLSLTLRRVAIRQEANPEPPVADLPELVAGVEWRQILRWRFVAYATFERPRIHINLPQLRKEAKDQVKLRQRGWQQALESIYPLKFNLVQMRDGDLVYVDADPKHPLHLSHWNITASNIRNIQSADRTYPSPIHSDAVIFDTGRGVLNGHADFLAEPFPGVHALYQVDDVPLDRLGSIVRRANLTLSGGSLASQGELEYGPKYRQVHVKDVTIRKLRLDYTHSPATAAAEEARGRKVREAAKDTTPKVPVRLDRLALVDSNLGLVSTVRDRRMRFFLDGADFTLTRFSTGFRQGPARVSLTGRFMGSGQTKGSATFRDDGKGPDFNLAAQVENGDLTALNELLRAYGKFDVAKGNYSIYTEVKVRDGKLTGYVKPLFSDIDVYSSKQDKKKPVLKKIYEKVVGGLSHILENRKRDEVATVAELSGNVDDPNTSAWDITIRMISNAFVKAILPGFEKEYEAALKRRR